MEKVKQRVEKWKNLLLDFSKRNRLYSFRPTKRTNLEISSPGYDELYGRIVLNNESLQFTYPSAGVNSAPSLYDTDVKTTAPSLEEQQKSLYVIRQRAKSAFDEQGVNVLYLIIGLLRWKPLQSSDEEILSPLILVPVQLSCKNLVSPFKLELHDSEEVVLNPTLKHKLIFEHNITLPDFDTNRDDLPYLEEYLEKITKKVDNFGKVERCVHMTLLSFLKMSMYEDINKNVERLNSNPHIRALCDASNSGEVDDSWCFDHFDHDKDTKPHDVYQILDADSSQMDAILAAKRGVSFVLQGPPGTGKSQTIANIIAETLAAGKKVLFVSEKRAALEVVYNRLHYAGLGDFCFTLHDHKANRRQILEQLQQAMNKTANRQSTQDTEALNVLQRKREELNRYHNELHTPCSGYNATAFQMIGELSKLSHVPDVIFAIPNVKQITKEYINHRSDLLHRLAAIIGNRKEVYTHNCWRYATTESFTQTLSQEIDAHLLPLIPKLRALRESLVTFCQEHEIEIAHSVDLLPQYKEVLQVASENPGFISHWIDSASTINLKNSTYKWESLINEVKEKRSYLSSLYAKEFLNTNPADYLNYLRDGVEYLRSILKIDNLDAFISSLSRLAQEIESIKEAMDSVYSEAATVACTLGIEKPRTRKELHRFVEVCDLLKTLQTVPSCWFNSATFSQVVESTPGHIIKHEKVSSLEKQINQNFDLGIFELDYEKLLRRFRTEYSSILKFINPSYYKDVKEIKAHYKHHSALRSNQIHSVLNSLKEREALCKEIETDLELLNQYYGRHYKGINSKWSIIKDHVTNFDKVVEILSGVDVPDSLKEMLQTGSLPISEINRFLNTWQNTVPVKLYTRINEIFLTPIDQDKDYRTYSEIYGQIVEFATPFLNFYSSIECLRKSPGQYTQILQDVEILQRLFDCERELENNKAALTHDYGAFYKYLETDWNVIRASLEYSESLKKIVRTCNLSEAFITHLSEDAAMPHRCASLWETVTNYENAIAEDLRWFANMFPVDMQKLIYSMDLRDLSNFAEVCQLNKKQLEDWIDFRTQRQRCVDAGLEEYIQYVENNTVPTEFIREGYLKRFYVLWLDAIKVQFPALNNFREELHEDLISQFRELDTLQFEIAVKRIQNKLWGSLPNFNIRYSRANEVDTLKRALTNKKRKALRRLFREIPNLAMALKPCFMMSPLSVSVFLESDAYNFDLVIFDEASQVHTEDAIGAIMRGKQVIIVGDDKQLPPTSFFRATISVDDYDDEDSDEIDECYESILSEAKAKGFREQTLRWHYRSRHEDLIAFSNIKFYDSKLITFPSTTVKAPDCGVEFVHVSDGFYEHKKNLREANRVAELVFDHFRKYGNSRTLGVVAFSEAQQSAIEAALIEYRRRDEAFEPFFNEEAEAPFFVKNLENVQGDERDTIIFSVGYAKDEMGYMHMRFGPLNIKDVGERRLNVAITRAKHNVKIVASILPTDIDTSRTQGNGVKLLRAYMEYAQQGTDALRNEISHNNQKDKCESPFERSVYDYLTSQGYQVQAQVGCSGYRIDMAVEHPHLHGKYAIGIECDGASYHSSRTARERDRLRQTILEDMGWTIYRIWSTDWIKSPETQKAKLKAAIEEEFKKNTVEPPTTKGNKLEADVNDAILPTSQISLKPEVFETMQTEFDFETTADFYSYDFVIYKYATMDPRWDQRNVGAAISHIIGIEQPIHIYELSKRLLPLFNRQKVTGAFLDDVEAILNKLPKSKKIKRIGDFLQLSNFSKVKVRVPEPGTAGRDVEYIHPKEIEQAFISIIRKKISISKKELFKTTANQFGFKRIGGNIKDIFEKVYKNALRYKKFVEVKGKVSWKQI